MVGDEEEHSNPPQTARIVLLVDADTDAAAAERMLVLAAVGDGIVVALAAANMGASHGG